MHYCGQGTTRKLGSQDMDMAGHHTPSEETIALGVKVEQRVLNHGGDPRISEGAAAFAGVERRLGGIEANIAWRVFEIPEDLQGKSVGEAEDNVLNRLGLVVVRQISPRSPAGVEPGQTPGARASSPLLPF